MCSGYKHCKMKRRAWGWLLASLLPFRLVVRPVRRCSAVVRPGPESCCKVFLSTVFVFRLATILNIFWRCLFTERMWAAGGNTQYKSHLDLCHAFNWLLCRCHGVAHSSLPPNPRHPLPLPWQAQSLAKPPSISCEIEFGGGQRLKNTSGKVCAVLACHDWLAGCLLLLLLPGQLPAFCQQLKANFSGRHLRDFQ